jgi:hypothetical protein
MASTAIARPQVQTGKAFIKTFAHADMPNFAVGDRVKFGADDQLLAAVTGGDDLSFGYVYQQNGTVVDVIMDGSAVIVVKVVAAGTATRGKYAVMSATANQYEDAPDNGGGTTATYLTGRFMNSGTDGDYVGMLIGGFNMRAVT